MCVIIVRPQGKTVEEGLIRTSWKYNHDGGGLAYVNDGELTIQKGFTNVDEFVKAIADVGDKNLIIHFRRASPGMVIDIKNCHPFGFGTHEIEWEGKKKFRFGFALAHNGKLPWRNTEDHSDTACFVHDYFRYAMSMDPYMLDHEGSFHILYNFINRHSDNKLAIFRYDRQENVENITIVGEKLGTWHEGCWFSNHEAWRKEKPAASTCCDSTYYHEVSGGFGKWISPSLKAYFEKTDDTGWRFDFLTHEWEQVVTKIRKKSLDHRPDPFVVNEQTKKAFYEKQQKEYANSKQSDLNISIKNNSSMVGNLYRYEALAISAAYQVFIKNRGIEFKPPLELEDQIVFVRLLMAAIHPDSTRTESQQDVFAATRARDGKLLQLLLLVRDEDIQHAVDKISQERAKDECLDADGIEHLEKNERKLLLKAFREYSTKSKATFDPQKMTIEEKIQFMRFIASSCIECCKDMDLESLDLYMINMAKEGKLADLLLKAEEKELSEELSEARDAEVNAYGYPME